MVAEMVVPRPMADRILERAAERLDALGHAAHPDAPPHRRGIEALAVIGDAEREGTDSRSGA